jgi:MFS family permease
MLASEAIFLLPFVVARVFRPTFLEVFAITNFELGTAFSWYGIAAMLSYFFGGPLADKFSPRKLMAISLLITGASGFYMAEIPPVQALQVLYGAWGISTILLFWAASLKATRAIGGQEQGLAFGLVDGGRGLLAAILASVSVLLMDWLLPVSASEASAAQWALALGHIIKLFSAFVLALGVVLWFAFPEGPKLKSKVSKIEWRKVLGHKALYNQALIVLGAYVAYKCTDDFSLYAHDSLGFNGIEAAHVGTISF